MTAILPIRTTTAAPEAIWTAKWSHELTESPQVFAHLPREAYDELPGLNASLLKVALNKSPAHAWAVFLDPNREIEEEVNQFLIGNLFHCRLLEPELFDQRYLVLPPDAPKRPTPKQLKSPPPKKDGTISTNTRAYAEWQEAKDREAWWVELEQQNAGKQIVDAKDLALGDALAGAVAAHPVLSPRFADTPANRAGNELTLTWKDSQTGARCKARLDALRVLADRLWIGDLKSAMDAGPGPDHFGKAAANFDYCLSAAFYLDAAYFCRAAIEKHLGLPEGALILVGREFEFIAVEKTHPRQQFVGRYILTDEQADIGRRMARKALDLCVQCEASGWWPGYDSAAQLLELPPYAWKRMERLAEGGP